MALSSPRSYYDLRGGVNLRDLPVGLAINELVTSQNMEPVQGAPYLQGRSGQTNYNAAHIDANRIRSLFRFYKQGGAATLIATSGTKIYKGNDITGVFTDISDVVYTNDQKFTGLAWSSKDAAYLTNGVEPAKKLDLGALTLATLGGTPPVGKYIELHQDRLWILQDQLASASDLNVDNVWPAVNAINVTDSKNSIGAFIKSLGDSLIIGKTGGLWRFRGTIKYPQELRRFSSAGCIAPHTADLLWFEGEQQPEGVIYLSNDGVRVTDGNTTTLISGKISPIFTTQFRNAVGKFWPKKRQYWLAFNTGGGAADQLWVASFIETPNGRIVAWNPYTNFNCESFAVLDGSADQGELYYGRSDDGFVRKTDVGTQDNGANYKCFLQTRWEDFGDKKIRKQNRWIDPVFQATKPVNYQIIYGFGDETAAGDLEGKPASAITWGPSAPVWGPGSVVWTGGAATNSTPTSTLDQPSARWLSYYFENTGDGANFKFIGFTPEIRSKDKRMRELFSLGART